MRKISTTGCHMQGLQTIQRMLPWRLRERIRDLADTVLANQRAERHTVHLDVRAVDDEYTRGRWDYLGHLPEMARYAVISGYCTYGDDVSTVLDLGCGAGVLHRWLRPLGLVRYVGVDVSSVAIEAAKREWQDAATTFVAMDVAAYLPDRKFDVIVFNEVLYYFERPDEILKRFADYLEENGRFAISLWDSPESRLAWRRSRGSIHVVDEVRVCHRSGVSWQIRLCRPRVSTH